MGRAGRDSLRWADEGRLTFLEGAHVSGRRFVQDWCAPSPSTHTDTAVLFSPWSPVASLGGDEGLLDQGLSWLVERWCVPY